MPGWIRSLTYIACSFAFLKMNLASEEKEEDSSDAVFLLYGTSDTDIGLIGQVTP